MPALGVLLVAVVFVRRPWCRVLCPLGGLLALACIYVLYQVISGGIDLHTVKALLEVFK